MITIMAIQKLYDIFQYFLTPLSPLSHCVTPLTTPLKSCQTNSIAFPRMKIVQCISNLYAHMKQNFQSRHNVTSRSDNNLKQIVNYLV